MHTYIHTQGYLYCNRVELILIKLSYFTSWCVRRGLLERVATGAALLRDGEAGLGARLLGRARTGLVRCPVLFASRLFRGILGLVAATGLSCIIKGVKMC